MGACGVQKLSSGALNQLPSTLHIKAGFLPELENLASLASQIAGGPSHLFLLSASAAGGRLQPLGGVYVGAEDPTPVSTPLLLPGQRISVSDLYLHPAPP